MDPPKPQQSQPTYQAAQNSSLLDEDCAFCQIISAYPVVSPLAPNFATSEALNPEALYPPAFILLSTEHVVAFLDIFPLVRGHVLLCPRRHAEKIGDMTEKEGMEIGRILPLLSRAVTRATMPDIPHAEVDYNVVQNNGPGAAQVVPHTHFHIIPRYPFDSTYQPYKSSKSKSSSTSASAHPNSGSDNTQPQQPRPIPQGTQATAILFGRGQRHYRDDEDAEGLIIEMRRRIAEEWRKTFGSEDDAETSGPDDEARERLAGGEQKGKETEPEAMVPVRRNKTVREDGEPVRLSGADPSSSNGGEEAGRGGGRGGPGARPGGRGRGNL